MDFDHDIYQWLTQRGESLHKKNVHQALRLFWKPVALKVCEWIWIQG